MSDLNADTMPMMIMLDRRLGYVQGNVQVVSTRAGRMVEAYSKADLLHMANTGTPPAGYTADEIRRMAEFIIF